MSQLAASLMRPRRKGAEMIMVMMAISFAFVVMMMVVGGGACGGVVAVCLHGCCWIVVFLLGVRFDKFPKRSESKSLLMPNMLPSWVSTHDLDELVLLEPSAQGLGCVLS